MNEFKNITQWKNLKITKLEWNDESVYGYLKDSILTLHKDGQDYTWGINDGDIAGEDWIVIGYKG